MIGYKLNGDVDSFLQSRNNQLEYVMRKGTIHIIITSY